MGMLRIAALVLALAVGFDQVVLDGRYLAAAGRFASVMLHHIR
jgi:hypothetical protein